MAKIKEKKIDKLLQTYYSDHFEMYRNFKSLYYVILK